MGDFWINIAVANSLPQIALENAARVLDRNGFDIVRSHLDIVSGKVLYLYVCVTCER